LSGKEFHGKTTNYAKHSSSLRREQYGRIQVLEMEKRTIIEKSWFLVIWSYQTGHMIFFGCPSRTTKIFNKIFNEILNEFMQASSSKRTMI